MLADARENICVLEKQLRAVFLLAKRSPEGKLPFVRYQQFFQIGDDLFMRLLRIEPSATTQYRDKVGFDTLLGHRGDLLKMEKEVSGLYLSGHPLDAYRAQISQISTCTIADLQGEDAKRFDNQNVTILCTVVKNKIMTTKSNTLMAFTTVEDLTGTMELLIFPRVLAECRAALQENAAGAVISGGLSVRQTEALAKRLSLEKPEKAPAPKGIDYAAEAQKELSSKLGRGVRIVTGRKKGRIELEYYGQDDLQRLYEVLQSLSGRE